MSFRPADRLNNQDMTVDTDSSASSPSARDEALLCLHGPLRKLAGNRAQHELAGSTVVELIRALEERHPEIGGWILDERGRIRRHINVFVAGDRAGEQTAVSRGDRVEVLPAITGGCR
jgi:molybdopterin converting factor small subunit